MKLITLLSLTILGLFLNGFTNVNSTLFISADQQAELESKMDMSRMRQLDYRLNLGLAMISTSAVSESQVSETFKKAFASLGAYDRCEASSEGMITCYADFNSDNASFITKNYSLFKKYIIVDVLAFDHQFGKWQAQRQEGMRTLKKVSKLSSVGGSWTLSIEMPYPITKINDNKVNYIKIPNIITIDLEEEFVTAESVLIESETDNIYGIVIIGALGLLLVFSLILGILIKQRKTITITVLLLTVYVVLILLELDGRIHFSINGLNETHMKSHQVETINTIEKEDSVKNDLEVHEMPQSNFYFTQNAYITDTEYGELKKMSSNYTSSEAAMIQTYSRLKKSLSNDAIQLLENDQNRWLNERNQDALNAGSKGSNEYLSELIRLTKDRTKELSEQL